MIWNALQITLIGMGGVFAFLVLLMGAMGVLRRTVERSVCDEKEKIAIAIAVARSREG